MDQDLYWMAYAIRLGHRGLGNTAENPCVGCVVVNNNGVVGLGYTAPGGRPHAEIQALNMAGSLARGASVYVTLEPCAHYGSTPPCVNALIAAYVSRVVIACEDPDPRVSGRGIERLKKAGIDVSVGIGRAQAYEDLAGFFSRIVSRRPQIILKLAVSSDNRLSFPGEKIQLTGACAQAHTHLLRAQCDAILVGINTVVIDNPQLTCRLSGLDERSPIPIVLDSHLRLPETAQLRQHEILWLLALKQPTHFMGEGIEVIVCRSDGNNRIDLCDALTRLADRGINRLMIEGGSQVARSFAKAGLIDILHLYRTKRTLGAGALGCFGDIALEEVLKAYQLCDSRQIGSDQHLIYKSLSSAPISLGSIMGSE